MAALDKDTGRLILAAALYAAVEIGLTLVPGHFLAWGRAEALLFFGFRPWCVLCAALALALGREGWRFRLPFYVAALGLASFCEGLFLLGVGASNPWPELARGMAGGLALAALADFAVSKAGRQWWAKLAAGLALAALLIAGGMGLYERIVIASPAPVAAKDKPRLLMMSAIPLRWGQWANWNSRPVVTHFYSALADEFTIDDLDVIDDAGLGRGTLLFLAQPRRLDPMELVRLDAWVRGGGRALILTDPLLIWPSDLPLGDARRPPPIGLLAPLLGHWGLRLDASNETDVRVSDIFSNGHRRRIALAAPGRFSSDGACTLTQHGLIATCGVGRGRAMLVADADLLHDALWLAPGADYRDPHRRLADNPLLVMDWLDGLAGSRRDRSMRSVAWVDPGVDPARALAVAAAPWMLAFAFGMILFFRRPR